MARPKTTKSDIERFQESYKLNLGNFCWEWQLSLVSRGYGSFWSVGLQQNVLAHRWSYQYFNGPIADELQVHHRCENKVCVNPFHIWAVTPAMNNLLSSNTVVYINSRKTHCIRGHEFTPENTYPNGKNKKGRGCRECMKIHQAEYSARRKQ